MVLPLTVETTIGSGEASLAPEGRLSTTGMTKSSPSSLPPGAVRVGVLRARRGMRDVVKLAHTDVQRSLEANVCHPVVAVLSEDC